MKRKSTSTPRGPDGRFTKKARVEQTLLAGGGTWRAPARTAHEVLEKEESKALSIIPAEGMIRRGRFSCP